MRHEPSSTLTAVHKPASTRESEHSCPRDWLCAGLTGRSRAVHEEVAGRGSTRDAAVAALLWRRRRGELREGAPVWLLGHAVHGAHQCSCCLRNFQLTVELMIISHIQVCTSQRSDCICLCFCGDTTGPAQHQCCVSHGSCVCWVPVCAARIRQLSSNMLWTGGREVQLRRALHQARQQPHLGPLSGVSAASLRARCPAGAHRGSNVQRVIAHQCDLLQRVAAEQVLVPTRRLASRSEERGGPHWPGRHHQMVPDRVPGVRCPRRQRRCHLLR